MGLSLTSIHQPLNDFFLNQFKTNVSSPIHFRFDKFGSVVSDDSFTDPNHPELGYVPSLAMETFSDLVNRAPVDTGDGLNIILSPANSIDDTYFFRLLSPAIAWAPDGSDDQAKAAIAQAFNAVKSAALTIWNNLKLESSTGLMLQFKPSLAMPTDWYDRSKTESWTHHSFQITDTSPAPASPLWRFKLSDQAMLQVLKLPQPDPAPSPQPLNLASHVIALSEAAPVSSAAAPGGIAGQPLHAFTASTPAHLMSAAAGHDLEHEDFKLDVPVGGDLPNKKFVLHNALMQQYRALDVRNKLIVSQYVGQNAPTQPPKTSSIDISFDYCLVSIRRAWWIDAFISGTSWYVPGLAKGAVTANGPSGNLPLLPIGLVAIRNLNIEAQWAPEDVANATVATDFGPFKVDGDIVNNKLSHPGLQIIGWMVQDMPDLPPVSDPALGVTPPAPPS